MDEQRKAPEPAARQVRLLQRNSGKLDKTTGGIHRAALKMRNVEMLSGLNYGRIGASSSGPRVSLFITFGEKRTNGTVLELDNFVRAPDRSRCVRLV